VPYCPACLTEYVEGTVECEDCGAKLQAGSPPEAVPPVEHPPGVLAGWLQSLVGAGKAEDSPSVKTVRLRTFSGPTATLDADLARNLLESQGIPVILPGETSVEMLPFLAIPLLVRDSDAERAARILRDYFDSPEPRVIE
jgi:hypothetical protein